MEDLRHKVYFDTDAWRVIGHALSADGLPASLRERVVLSPITVLELLSQLALSSKGERILREVQSVRNWVDPTHGEMLSWPNVAIAHFGFGVSLPTVLDNAATNLNAVLNADSVAEVRAPASVLMDALKQVKVTTVGEFRQLIELWRKGELTVDSFDEVWLAGVAKRVGVDPTQYKKEDVIAALSAYHEFERQKLLIAVKDPQYKPENHANDLLDAEQLTYLADPRLHLLTAVSLRTGWTVRWE